MIVHLHSKSKFLIVHKFRESFHISSVSKASYTFAYLLQKFNLCCYQSPKIGDWKCIIIPWVALVIHDNIDLETNICSSIFQIMSLKDVTGRWLVTPTCSRKIVGKAKDKLFIFYWSKTTLGPYVCCYYQKGIKKVCLEIKLQPKHLNHFPIPFTLFTPFVAPNSNPLGPSDLLKNIVVANPIPFRVSKTFHLESLACFGKPLYSSRNLWTTSNRYFKRRRVACTYEPVRVGASGWFQVGPS